VFTLNFIGDGAVGDVDTSDVEEAADQSDVMPAFLEAI
jgi:hypothetical protein